MEGTSVCFIMRAFGLHHYLAIGRLLLLFVIGVFLVLSEDLGEAGDVGVSMDGKGGGG